MREIAGALGGRTTFEHSKDGSKNWNFRGHNGDYWNLSVFSGSDKNQLTWEVGEW